MGKIIRNVDVAIGRFKGKLTKQKADQILEKIFEFMTNANKHLIGRSLFKLKKDKELSDKVRNSLNSAAFSLKQLQRRINLD
jgi:hypothetical protein